MNVYCVGTPFQMVSALEARYHFQSASNLLIVRDTDASRTMHRTQMENMISMLEWDAVIHWPKFQGWYLPRQIRNRKFVKRVARKLDEPVDALFIGGFRQARNHYLRNALKPRQTVMLDDGVATFKHIERYISQNIFCPEYLSKASSKRSVSCLLDRCLFGIDDSVMGEPVDVFTCFKVKVDAGIRAEITRHQFQEIRKNHSSVETMDSRVDYLGSPLYERGMLTLERERQFLQVVADHYSESGLKLKYLAHRDDSDEKLDMLKSDGLQVERPGYPAEIHFLLQESQPAVVASGVSTGLHNVFRILPGIDAQLAVIPSEWFLDGKRTSEEIRYRYREILAQYESAGIKIVHPVEAELL